MRKIILFYSTNQALWAADVLNKYSIKHKMVPVPRELSSDCGYCIEFFDEPKENIERLLIDQKMEFDSLKEI